MEKKGQSCCHSKERGGEADSCTEEVSQLQTGLLLLQLANCKRIGLCLNMHS